ncbi:MAG: cysteine rich repeat-containing protein [Alphaproteobacteria bacterium]|nr:cysteine rich repeat-containing protein [Alphaproteobacteria bacterium]
MMNPRRFRLAIAATVGLLSAQNVALAQTQIPSEMKAEASSLVQVCRADFDKLCAGVRPGGGRIVACLESHAAELSAPCRDALPRAEALKAKAATAGVLPQ